MKTPGFWYAPDKRFLAALLTPLGVLYRAGYMVRRAFVRPAQSCSVPLICVGNIVVGGAGKTPTAIALARQLLFAGARPVFVTRGYGGKMRGPLRVNLGMHSAADVGDEALLLASVAPCWIGRSRTQAIRFAEKEATHIILDDGLQNPALAPMLSFLVVDGAAGLGNGKLFPSGPLRETLHDAFSRVDAIVMIGQDKYRIGFCLGKELLKASLAPRVPSTLRPGTEVFAFAGIGRPQKFYDTCAQTGLNVVEKRDFPDHHVYTAREIDALGSAAAKKRLKLVTTAKDWVRLPEAFRKNVDIVHVDLLFEDKAALEALLDKKTKKTGFPFVRE